MRQNPEQKIREQTMRQTILRAMLFWAIGGFIFGVVEFWVGIAIYPWVFRQIDKFVFGPFIYAFIGMLGGGISYLLAKALQVNWLKDVKLEAFYVATNISFITLIWSAIWTRDVFELTRLNPIIDYVVSLGLILIFYILGHIVYKFTKRKKDSQRLIASFIAISFSLYTFVAVEMYLYAFFPTSIIYVLLIFAGSIILGLGIYYISLLLTRFNWGYQIGIVATLAVVITIIIGLTARSKDVNAQKSGISSSINIMNRNEVINRKKPNILFLTVDTLRADSLSCYSYDQIKTTAIDRLANNGVLFARTIAQAPWTLPSFASMLTSLYPSVHGANKIVGNAESFSKVNKSVIWLPEILKDVGYSTQAFVNNGYISTKFGFGKGFDNYYNLADQPDQHRVAKRRRAFLWTKILPEETTYNKNETATITQKAIDWLESTPSKPFFLWVHYFDPHDPYERYKTYNLNPGYSGRLKNNEFVRGLHHHFIKLGKYNLKKADKNYLKSIYDEEILLVDESIGLILNKLEELNLVDNTLIIFTSDHGEEFWEHNDYQHGHTLYQELVHIPLLVQLPGVLPHGVSISQQVQAIDIMPTILDMLGIEQNLNLQGKSLLPLINKEETDHRITFSESLIYFEERKSLRTGKYNFIYFPDSKKRELYDLENDHLELKNIIDERPELGARLQSKLSAWLKDCRKMAKDLGTDKYSKPIKLDKETKEKLKALGYL